ncbi:MAG: N-acetylmuramoyl-L-alanine amidase [Gammaproteobacteria bacterium]|jgi:N-acetylmuramoyl-L-alanine amidase
MCMLALGCVFSASGHAAAGEPTKATSAVSSPASKSQVKVSAEGTSSRAGAATPRSGTGAGTTAVKRLRMWPAPDHTRLVLDVTGPVEHTIFRLSSPERLVIDLANTRLAKPLGTPPPTDGQIRSVRSANRGSTDLRIVLDLKREVSARSFLLRPNPPYGHRLVVDLRASAAQRKNRKAVQRSTPSKRLRDVVIAIDAGHGGEDPGASGKRGVQEKDVVLQISRRLAKELGRMRGIKPVLVRTGDYYVGLRKRIERAREARADLFLSIHADAFRDRRVRGSSVYVLSRNGASSEAAKVLADKENASDLVGGVSLDDKDPLLASVLLDLSQAAALSASGAAGGEILRELNGLGKLHKREVQRAGFVVLKSPDIPSILVETGFISNPTEERRLRDPAYQAKLARRIAQGLQRYFVRNAPEGSFLAQRKHIVSSGETLSHVSARYEIPLKILRSENRLANDRVVVGQVLRIPSG